MVAVHKLRHWKQQYHPNAAFICRRRMAWGGRTYEPGGRIPAELAANKAKLRRFWEAGWIELAEFQAPDVATGQPAEPELPEEATLEQHGSWYVVTLPDGTEHKAQGSEARDALLAELLSRPWQRESSTF